MKIAIINVVGVEGSTGEIATKLANTYISNGHECRIYHGRGKKQRKVIYRRYGNLVGNAIHYLMERITNKEGEYSFFFSLFLIKDILSFAPEIVILLNLHGHYMNIPILMNRLASQKIKTIYFMCDEFPYTSRCEYVPDGCAGYLNRCENCPLKYKSLTKQYRKKNDYYDKYGENIGFASVGYITNRAKRSSLLKGRRIYTINTGIDTAFFHPVDAMGLRKKLGIASDKIVLVNAALYTTKRKGIEYYIEIARAFEEDDRFVFINIGYNGPRDILPSNYIAVSYVEDQEGLREYFSMADAYICTSTMDALPNACVLAMSCGTPIVGFPVSGIPFLADEPTLHLVDGVGAKPMIDYLRIINPKTTQLSNKCRRYALDNYSFNVFSNKLLEAAMDS